MKLGRLIAAAVVLAALAGTLYWSNKKKAAEDAAAIAGPTGTTIVSVKQEDISKLEIKKKDEDAVVMDRVGAEQWKITSPKPLIADHETISTILYDLSPLKADEVIDQKPADVKAFGLTPPVVEVTATSKDGKAQKLLIGDDTPTGGAAYAMLEGDPRLFTVGSTYKSNFDKGLKELRDKRLLPLDFDKLSKVEISGPKLNITMTNANGKWAVQAPKDMRADPSTLSDVVDKLRLATVDLGTDDPDGKKAAAAFAAGTPVATAKVTDPSGSQTIQIRKNKTDYYAKSSAVDSASKVSNDLGADVDKSTEDFREKWVLDLRDANPDKVELHDGPKTYSFSKVGEDWVSEGKKLDPVTIENFVNTLRTLTASKFATSGFSNPTIDLTVTSGDGKKTENVKIAKSGNDYLGKRADGSLLYQIDAKRVEDMEKTAGEIKPAAPPAAPATSK